MKKAIFTIVTVGAFFLVGPITEAKQNAAQLSSTWERMRGLQGRWEGEVETKTISANAPKVNGQKEKIIIEFKKVSAGRAILETVGPGSPYEMIGVFFDRNSAIVYTEYSMSSNCPALEAKTLTDTKVEFLFSDDKKQNASSTYLGDMTLTWKSENQIVKTWTSYQNGQPFGTSTATLTRIK